jgi:hypothetical protein
MGTGGSVVRKFLASFVSFAALTGCINPQTARPQIGEEPAEKDALVIVGARTDVSNVEPVQVHGVGLVVNLNGTGSSAPPGEFRIEMERLLRSRKLNAKELLDDPGRSTSLVTVTAMIPAGARSGDPIVVQVNLPPNSKTSSLKGGYLAISELSTYETAENIRATLNTAGMQGGDRPTPSGLVKGDIWARCEGPLVVGSTGTTATSVGETAGPAVDAAEHKVAQVWDGGVLLKPRPYFFLLAGQDQRPVLAMQIASRLNDVFQPIIVGSKPIAEAKPIKPGAVVLVTVPPSYRHNHYRFLLVARQVPLTTGPDLVPYRKKLEEELLDPKSAIVAAVKLEALGPDAVPSLKLGMQSESPWVKFAAAESLAYLGRTDGAEELGNLAERHPGLRYHCLKALAALDDAASTAKLTELLAHPDSQLRYGAFAALRIADKDNEAIRSERVKERAFHLHRIAPNSPGLVTLSTQNRAEIVAFGDGGKLTGPFTLPVGSDFTVVASDDGTEIKVSRVIRNRNGADLAELKCRPDLVSVLQTLAELGGGYADAVELVRRADRAKILSASVMFDTTPPGLPTQELARLARIDPTLEKTNGEALRVGASALDVSTASHDLPNEAESIKPTPERPSLNRDPGRIFGPKQSDDVEPASGILPLPEAK